MAYGAYEKYNFYPTYFGCFDYVVNESHKEAFNNLVLTDNGIKEFYFIGNNQHKQNFSKEFKIIQDSNISFYSIHFNKYPGISKDFDHIIQNLPEQIQYKLV